MKKAINFIRDTSIKGFIIIIPMAIVGFVLIDAVKTLIAATAPLTKNMTFGGPLTKAIISILIVSIVIITIFFLLGLIFKSTLGRIIVGWIDNKILMPVPMYSTIKGITNQLANVKKSNYPIAEIDLHGNGVNVLGMLTEELKNDRHLVYIPMSPLVNFGQMHIVPKDKIKILDVSVPDALETLTRLGFEGKKIFE